MAFDPLDWISLAETLSAGPDEASLRAAIGRYYYGVFLKCRLSLTHDNLITPGRSAGDHSLVVRTLKRHRAIAGTAIENLYRLREDADYEPGTPISAADVSKARTYAKEVVRMCGGDWARLP